jgi:hypothetical protein
MYNIIYDYANIYEHPNNIEDVYTLYADSIHCNMKYIILIN